MTEPAETFGNLRPLLTVTIIHYVRDFGFASSLKTDNGEISEKTR
jgi:hypothetical protein